MAKILEIKGKIKEVFPKRGSVFSQSELASHLGCRLIDLNMRELLSGDVLVIRDQAEDRNRLAESITRFPEVFGDALLCDAEEVD